MKKTLICLTICAAMLLAALPFGGAVRADAAGETITVELPLSLELSGATGVNLNIRLDPLKVKSAQVVRMAQELSSATLAYNQDGAKLKVAMASATPMNFSGDVFYLKLTLYSEYCEVDELFKLLQIKINEKITWQASDCIILSGVRDGGVYNCDVYPSINEGDALLDGELFIPGAPVSREGDHVLEATDLNGKKRTVRFTIDKTAPIISVVPYDTKPAAKPFTVYVTVNEGTLEVDHHVFEDNGSFTFRATDAAGNTSSLTVTLTHLRDFLPGDVNGDDTVDSNDAIHLLYNVFFGEENYPVNQPCDFNGDGAVDANDAIYLLYNVFFGDEAYPLS
jgi:hypothetical protein